MTTGGALLAIGIAVDVVGIALVSAADWVPDAVDVSTAIRLRLKSAITWVARLFHRHRSVTVQASTGGAVAVGGSVGTLVEPGTDASPEDRVAFLVRESKRTQGRLNELERVVAELPGRWRRDVDAARDATEQLIDRRLNETKERYRGARQLGLVCLIAGLVLVSLSNAF